jgi:chromosome segregation ATPase
MEEIHQLIKRVDWLDKERQKDQQKVTALTERIATLEKEKAALEQRLKGMDSDITKAVTTASRVTSVDAMLDQMRADVTKQIETLESRRADSEREQERLRQIEREGLNRALAEVRKSVDSLPRLEQEMTARKEEERRMNKLMTELQTKVTEVARRDEERAHSMASLEEGRRQDAKRVVDVQAELPELRKRGDEYRTKLEILEDLVRRNDVRVGEILSLENDRKLSQMAWMETQAVAGAERERAWNDLKQRAEVVTRETEDFSHRMEVYSETHRQMKKTIDDYYVNLERTERRIGEAAEIQRLSEERFRQEWNAFLADEQKRWTTHMLLRDEQWRDHDRQSGKMADRLAALEEQVPDVRETIRGMQAIDQSRLQALFNFARELVAEYDQTLTKVR